ncbi:porin family protein [Aminobacter sp. SR38]|jgi:outer membrane immunogenic protein|uniref:outer membrane protein n=1 Tax=Aminobacter sp. SR38 TaxID=2774562 RepID=UPI00177BDF37|nr:outer membrane protein [Aminobacter sp. SR38]QOF70716.1 porin family protein [Aminobacter sp. SR38]
MKSVLLASTIFLAATGASMAADAVAADPVAAPYNWTGFYAGVHGGYAWGSGDGPYPDAAGVRFETAYPEADGGLLGVQVGYNHQWGNWVLGLEGDLSYSWADGSSGIEIFPGGGDAGGHTDSEFTYLASITGRAGYAFDRTLLYAKGGIGFTRLEITDYDNPASFNARGSKTLTGWTIGGGVEHALNDKWSVKGEYQFYRFSGDVAVNDPALFRTYEGDFNVHAVKIGLNYKF